MNDGLSSGELRISTISGTAAQFATISGTIAAEAGTIGNAELGANAASGTKVSPEYAPVYGAGSPVTVNTNRVVQMGSGTANTYVVFAKPFAAAPAVGEILVGAAGSAVANALPYPTNPSAGSFLPSGAGAIPIVYWAAGSGRV